MLTPTHPAIPLRTPAPRLIPAWLRERPELALTPLLFLLIVTLWQGVAWLELVSRFILPAPSHIAQALVQGIASGLFLQHGLVTVAEAATGFGLAVAAGLVVGTLIAEFRILERAV